MATQKQVNQRYRFRAFPNRLGWEVRRTRMPGMIDLWRPESNGDRVWRANRLNAHGECVASASGRTMAEAVNGVVVGFPWITGR